MKLAILTSNSLRHKFFANYLSKFVEEVVVISECREIDENNNYYGDNKLIKEHFQKRFETEKKEFSGNEVFESRSIPILYKEVNSNFIYQYMKNYDPDMMIVFGTSIIKDPLLSLGKKNRFINLHLGLSPYYKGNGTNFWPFVNEELEYLGSTILHIDKGVDTGDIVMHVRPKIFTNDNVHTIGCRIIRDSAENIGKILLSIKNGNQINRIKQWHVPNEKIYKLKDFNEDALRTYYQKLDNGLIQRHLKKEYEKIKVVEEFELK